MSFLLDKIPNGFIYDDTTAVKSKITGFGNAGIDKLQLVLDFDRTLTEKSDQNSTSWQLMRNHLPPEGKVESGKIYDYYRALELAEKLTVEEALEWWTSSMAIVAKHRLDMASVERDFLAQSTIRPGTKELFDICIANNIPTVIMSAGIKDIIDMWCRTYDIHPTMILSTALTLDQNNRVTGWDDSSVVHMFNKHEINHPELSKIRTSRPYTILAGDSLHDHNMAEGTDTVFRVRIHDTDDNGRHNPLNPETFKLFDSVIEDGTLQPIVELIKQIK